MPGFSRHALILASALAAAVHGHALHEVRPPAELHGHGALGVIERAVGDGRERDRGLSRRGEREARPRHRHFGLVRSAPVTAGEGPQALGRRREGRARAAQLARVDGGVGLVFAPGGKPFVVFDFVIDSDSEGR